MTQFMFERFHVPVVIVTVQAATSLFASRRTTGIVIDSCNFVSHAVPVNEVTHCLMFSLSFVWIWMAATQNGSCAFCNL